MVLKTWTCNPHLLEDLWLKNIIWNKQFKASSPPLLWDLNDPHMRFQLQEGANPRIVEHAVATVLPAHTRVSAVISCIICVGIRDISSLSYI